MNEKEQAEINSRKLSDYILLKHNGVMTARQIGQKLTEDKYILFSDEEIAGMSDEYDMDLEQSVREDIEM